MSDTPLPAATPPSSPTPAPRGLLGRCAEKWHAIPLYLRILAACGLGVAVGLLLQARAAPLAIPSQLVLRLLGALAAPLVLFAVVQALMQAQIPRGNGVKLIGLLILNTVMAILIGLTVANVVRPGRGASLAASESQDSAHAPEKLAADPLQQVLDNVPRSLVGPFTDGGKVTSVIMIAVALGIALRKLPAERFRLASDLVAVGFDTLLVLLYWVIEVIPLAVFGIVASIVGKQGFGAFLGLGAFVGTVLLGLALQLGYYLLQIRLWSWPRPLDVLRGMRDALVMAFSTASSTATMPVTYACLREKSGSANSQPASARWWAPTSTTTAPPSIRRWPRCLWRSSWGTTCRSPNNCWSCSPASPPASARPAFRKRAR